MIRINLLPVKQAKKREYGRQQLVLFVVLIVLEFVVLFMIHQGKQLEVDNLNQTIAEIQADTTSIEQIQSEITSIRARMAQIQRETQIVEDLRANRIGPGAVLDDLKYIMNSPTSEVEIREQSDRGFNTAASPNNVWLTSLTVNPGSFSMVVTALTPEDVAEFLLRLETSPRDMQGFFVRPQLSGYRTGIDTFYSGVKHFTIAGGIRYQRMEL